MKIIVPTRDEVIGEWTRLYNEELYDLWSSSNIVRGIKSRRPRWVGHVKRMGGQKRRIKDSDGKRPLGRRRHRWKPNIKIGLREMGRRKGLA